MTASREFVRAEFVEAGFRPETECIEAAARAASAPRLVSAVLRLRRRGRSQLPAIRASFFAFDQPWSWRSRVPTGVEVVVECHLPLAA